MAAEDRRTSPSSTAPSTKSNFSLFFFPSCVLVVSFKRPSPSICSSQRGWCSERRLWARSVTCWLKTCTGTRKRRRDWPVSRRKCSDYPTGTRINCTLLSDGSSYFWLELGFHSFLVCVLQVTQRKNCPQQTELPQHAGEERDWARKQHGTVLNFCSLLSVLSWGSFLPLCCLISLTLR